MPYSSTTFNATTGGVPTANFSFAIGAIPAGALVIAVFNSTSLTPPTDDAGNTYSFADLDLFFSENSLPSAAATINMNNAGALNFDIIGVIIDGLDNVLGPFDLEGFVDENPNPASTTHSTGDPDTAHPGNGGPITVVATNEVLIGFFIDNGKTGGAITAVDPLPEAINMFGMAIGQSAGSVAPGTYNAIFDTVNSISDCGVTIFSLILAATPPAGTPSRLASQGVG